MGGECKECPNGVLHQRVGDLEQQMARQTAVLERLDHGLVRLIELGERQIRVEERQIEQGKASERVFQAIGDEEEARIKGDEAIAARVKKLEDDQPRNRMVSDWVIEAFKLLAVGGLGAMLAKMI